MANKKKGKGPQQTKKLSPEKYMRERARKQPIRKCYITKHWKEQGMATVVVTRERSDGNFVVGIYLVDTFCLGVKDAAWNNDMSPETLVDNIKDLDARLGIDEVSYNEAHNLVYGALAFAEDAGVAPHRDFGIARYVLEEDTDDIPLIEYEYGKDGKHFLIIGKEGKESRYLPVLQKNLGDGNFDSLVIGGFDDEDDDADYDMDYPEEPYSYVHPEYPASPVVKHQFIADEMLSKDNVITLPRHVIERILALDPDEAAEDIGNVALYEIGRTYKAIADDPIGKIENGAILHALFLLTEIGSGRGLGAMLELMRQTIEFCEYHIGDLAYEDTQKAIYACGRDNIQAIESFIYEKGLKSLLKGQAIDALAMVAHKHPGRRAEIIETMRRILTWMEAALPQMQGCDGHLAGIMMCCLVNIDAKELLPEIKAVYATGCVDPFITGDYDKVEKWINKCDHMDDDGLYPFPDIYSQYEMVSKAWGD